MSKELTESRRTRYTRLAMQDALVELLQDQPLGSITVKALCERADVNRSTFYAHYTSIEDLLHDIEDETMAWVTAALDQLLAQPDSAGIEHVIERICQYIADNRKHLPVSPSSCSPPPTTRSRPKCACASPYPAASAYCNTGSPPTSQHLRNQWPTPFSPWACPSRSELVGMV